jgi:hypothetical protein
MAANGEKDARGESTQAAPANEALRGRQCGTGNNAGHFVPIRVPAAGSPREALPMPVTAVPSTTSGG